MMPVRSVLGILLVGLFAGCVGSEGGEPAGGPSVAAGPAQFDDATGGINGLVTDEELAPLAGATVGLLEIPDARAATDADGRFSLSALSPGTYTLAVQSLGYETVAQKVEVRVGEATEVQVALPVLPVVTPYPETIIFNGIIRNGVGLVRTATCSNCNVNDNNKETVARFPGGHLPEDYAGVMIESTWRSSDFIGIDLLDRTAGTMYWRIRAEPPIHFLVEKCGNYVGAPWYGRHQMVCDEDNLTKNKVHVENWYIGGFQDETHTLDPVCQQPVGAGGITVVPGYQAGCYGLGYVAELRFTNYLTIFHVELPGDAGSLSFMPDA